MIGTMKNSPFARSTAAAPPPASATTSQRRDALTIATEESTVAIWSSVSA
jgi:hypothetical protein